MRSYQRLTIDGWRQFSQIDINIHPRLTVLTGANGTGKTTLLGLLTRPFGWSQQLLSTPVKAKDGSWINFTGAIRSIAKFLLSRDNTNGQIGQIYYSDGQTATILAPPTASVVYNVEIQNQQDLPGLYIPSHRTYSQYQQIGNIPTTGVTPQQAYSNYYADTINRITGGHTQFSPMYRLKESLIAMATFGEGNKYVTPQPALLAAYTGFIDVLRAIFPPSIGFRTIDIRTPDVVLVTNTGEFLIDAVSGGMRSLIDFAWQIHMFSLDKDSFVVVIDEPENHLHPSMQRTLMPSLLNAFPAAQFVVATHSPFVVTSVKDSNVYVLMYEAAGLVSSDPRIVAPSQSVRSVKLDTVNRAATANEILRDVLGLDSTMPLWVSRDLDDIVTKYRHRELDGPAMRELNEELRRSGLTEFLPDAIQTLTR